MYQPDSELFMHWSCQLCSMAKEPSLVGFWLHLNNKQYNGAGLAASKWASSSKWQFLARHDNTLRKQLRLRIILHACLQLWMDASRSTWCGNGFWHEVEKANKVNDYWKGTLTCPLRYVKVLSEKGDFLFFMFRGIWYPRCFDHRIFVLLTDVKVLFEKAVCFILQHHILELFVEWLGLIFDK